MSRPSKIKTANRHQAIRTLVAENPGLTAKELRREVVNATWISNGMKNTLNYYEIMRRLSECCEKGPRRECSVSKSLVTTWVPRPEQKNIWRDQDALVQNKSAEAV